MIAIFGLDRRPEGTMRVTPDALRATIHEIETSLAARDG
jgi:hypothetical protein